LQTDIFWLSQVKEGEVSWECSALRRGREYRYWVLVRKTEIKNWRRNL